MLDFYSKEKFSLKKGTGLSEKRDRVKLYRGRSKIQFYYVPDINKSPSRPASFSPVSLMQDFLQHLLHIITYLQIIRPLIWQVLS